VRRLTVDAQRPDPAVVAHAADAIRAGGLVIAPTDTLYALVADPFNAAAVERVFQAKGRSGARALPLIACDGAQVAATLGQLSPMGKRLAERFWPGPLTLLIAAPVTLAPGVTGGTGRVGVRVPAHAVARALCAACGHPLTATSANPSGAPPTSDPREAARSLEASVDVLLDAGTTPGGLPSTLVDVSGTESVLVRAGTIEWKEILAWLDGARGPSERRSSD